MSLNSETALYGILGHPVRHSLSPLLHNALFKKHHINAAYLAFEPDPASLPLAFEGIRSLGIRGVNVTIPFKEEAENLCDEVPEDIDRASGAVNTIVNRNGELYGYNTDGPGFILSLKEDLSFDASGKTALVIGAGGAARGVAFALGKAGAEEVLILNRSAERARGLQEFASGYFTETEFRAAENEDALRAEKIDLVVNATSLGMHAGDALPMDLKKLKQKAAVLDLVYAPAKTRFMDEAVKLGFANAGGLGMLTGQAALAFTLWTGISEGVRESMMEELNKWKR